MMFCENCGAKMDNRAKYCENCGVEVTHTGSTFLSRHAHKFNPEKLHRGLAIFMVVLILSGLGLIAYARYSQSQKNLLATIQKQSTQTAQLENQIKDVQKQAQAAQQQTASATQSLTDQLNAQKTETDKAEKQAQLAQQALALAKQQTQNQPIKEDNTFPSINSGAIVLIVCFDGSGNPAQSGSGTIVTADGYVLTNRHVVTDSLGNELSCGAFMNDGNASPSLQTGIIYSLTTDAPNAGFYNNYDAVLLKIDGALNSQTDTAATLPSSFPYIKPQGGNLKEGDTLYIFGYPAASNLVYNVTRGIVSSFTSDGVFINTDAVIDHGNSGGAAITSDGRFVGIPTQKYVGNSDYLGQILRVENLSVPSK
jgi:S1-C subfamily serine protease